MIELADIISGPRLAAFGEALDGARWEDGRATAGQVAAGVKNNRQLAPNDDLTIQLGGEVLDALGRSALFQSAALPFRISTPLLNRHEDGEAYGAHVDNAIRPAAAGPMRADLAATLFLSDPADYEGGALVIDDALGRRSIKLPAGHMILYPATSRHRVEPVARGVRHACIVWIQSMVRADADRATLLDIDRSIQLLRRDVREDHPALLALTGCYHNLLRRWAEL